MPLLRREEEVFPPDIFDLDPASAPWAVAHVKSRCEKTLARLLAEREVPFYLPQVEKQTTRDGRRRVSHLPLFPGYLFFRSAGEGRHHVVRSPATASIIDVADQITLTEELRQLRTLQLAGASLRLVDELVPGDSVRVREGVFSGYHGVVESARGNDRLVIRVTLLQKAVAIEFATERLTRASGGILKS